jgi:MoaA/NifB/PqqE/SkfB family radical SAM enzyme
MTGYISLGYACNNSCIICPISTKDRFLTPISYEDIENCMETILKDKCLDTVIISGGEPTLYPELKQSLQFLLSNNIRVMILSNNIKFSEAEYTKKLFHNIDTGKVSVVTALHHHDSSIHDNITRNIGSYKKSLIAIKNLLNAGVHVSIKHIINKMNYKDLVRFSKFMEEGFCNEVTLEISSTDYEGQAMKNMDCLYVKYDQIRPYLESMLDVFDLSNREVKIIETPLCMVDPKYWNFFSINESNNFSLYVAAEVNTENHMENNSTSNCNTCYKECKECKVKSICPGVYNSIYKCDHNVLHPI